MCPPASPLGPDCTGRDIFKVLDPAQPGDHIPLPSDVQTGINLHEYHPENLPGIANGCWYLLRSPFKMETDTGFWKATGDARRIYSDGRVSGWESTREFYEPNDHRTHWVMQEYTITHNVPNLLEVLYGTFQP
uniref:Putative NAC domain class transcription factor n=1 Tax=Tamarix hispida TaxID=189793 RepID=T2CBJ9_9CARY|nr:putative NAC domain class transcription factor [Tamarix hispida]